MIASSTDNCDLCGRAFKKKDKPIKEMMVVEGTAVHFTMHETCKNGLDWYLQMYTLARKNKRAKKPLKNQSKLEEEEHGR